MAHEATTLFTAGGMCRVAPGSRLILTNDRGAAQGARPYGHEPREQGPRGNRHDPRIVIEFPTTPGKTYTIIYSDNNLFTWQVATPSITASATTTQWYDDGPPKTDSKPFSITSRFYRVIAAH